MQPTTIRPIRLVKAGTAAAKVTAEPIISAKLADHLMQKSIMRGLNQARRERDAEGARMLALIRAL